MDSRFLRAAGRAVGALVAMTVVGAGLAACDGPMHPPPAMELTMTSTDATAPVVRGEDAHFIVTVTNPSPHEVRDVEFLEFTDDAKTGFRSATCRAQGGATCPETNPGPWSTPSMPAGSSLTFDVTVAVYFTVTSTFENTFIVQSRNRSTSLSTTAHGTVVADARSGTYRMYASEGGLSGLTLEMMGGTLTLDDGAASPVQLLPDGSYLSTNGVRWGAGSDVLVGQLVADARPQIFIAARRFVTTVAELDGVVFNMFATELTDGADRQARAFAAWFAKNTLTLCTQALLSAANCPVASLQQYELSVVDGVFTGVDAAHGRSLTFQVAKSDRSLVFLRAANGPDFHGLEVGIAAQDAVGVPFPFFGATTRGDWGDLTLWDSSYLANWATASSGILTETAALSPVADANIGLWQGQRSSDGATLYGAFDATLAVMIGSPAGPANGELQLFSQTPRQP